MDKYSIVRAAPELLPDIDRIEKASFSDPWSKESLASSIYDPSTDFLCAVTDSGQVIGYAVAICAADESELLNIAVECNFRKKGLAKALLEKEICKSAEKGASVMYLEVRESNTPARNLYKSFGFTEIGKRKNYYRAPAEDAILMAKDLRQTEPV